MSGRIRALLPSHLFTYTHNLRQYHISYLPPLVHHSLLHHLLIHMAQKSNFTTFATPATSLRQHHQPDMDACQHYAQEMTRNIG